MLDDGTYEALVFGADDGDPGVVVELTVVAGDHKGEVVSIRSDDWDGDAIDLLGVPATIVVTDGRPAVRFEPGA